MASRSISFYSHQARGATLDATCASRSAGTPARAIAFVQILSFATTIHDRVYLINGQFGMFNITLEGEALILAQAVGGRGALLLGAHMGSFEVMHSLGRGGATRGGHGDVRGECRKINAILATINPHLRSDIVSLGRIDAMLNVAERLDRGAFVGVLVIARWEASRCKR